MVFNKSDFFNNYRSIILLLIGIISGTILGLLLGKQVEILKPIVKDKMTHAIKMEVPIEVEMGTGINWLEAH